jgi:hypothetical protein
MLLITFLTVGYGEYYPVTFTGRVVAILTVIIGQVTSAMIIGIVHNSI